MQSLVEEGIGLEYRPIGKTDIKITPILMGTWQAGKKDWVGIDDQVSRRAIQAAFDSGINAFDTAEAYGSGQSERILASTLSRVRDREYAARRRPSSSALPPTNASSRRGAFHLETRRGPGRPGERL